MHPQQREHAGKLGRGYSGRLANWGLLRRLRRRALAWTDVLACHPQTSRAKCYSEQTVLATWQKQRVQLLFFCISFLLQVLAELQREQLASYG